MLPGALLSAGCFRLLCLHAVAFDYIPCNVPSAQLNTPYSLFSPPSASVLQRACRMHGGGGSGGEDGEDEEELPSLPKLPARCSGRSRTSSSETQFPLTNVMP